VHLFGFIIETGASLWFYNKKTNMAVAEVVEIDKYAILTHFTLGFFE
jgi:hypothetical protein